MTTSPASLTPLGGGVRVPKAAELVALDLCRQIIRGHLTAGEALPNETALMEAYDVSRSTLREALRILESEGLVSVKRGAHGGARVHLPDVGVAAKYTGRLLQVRNTTIADVFQARRVLEPAAARALAKGNDHLALKALRTQQELERLLLEDPVGFASAATAFHRLLVELAGNNTLAVFSGMIDQIVDRHHRDTFAGGPAEWREYAEEGSKHHRHVLDLIEGGDGDGAEALWRVHLDRAAERAMRVLGVETIVDLLD
jgi:DNA-binding FadR family transcriptional regulator